MRLGSRAHLVGSGRLGLTLTDPYDCNVFLIDGGSELALVDTGAGYRPDLLIAAIERAGFDPAQITKLLLTHKHADHAGGAAAVLESSSAAVHASAATAEAVADGVRFNDGLSRARANGSYPGDYVFRPVAVDVTIAEGDSITVGDLTIDVIETPGHCAGHCSFGYRAEGRTVLLTGDAIFPLGQVVLQPIVDCSVVASVQSIEKLASQSWDVLLPGHLSPVLNEASWHVETAAARLRSGRLPNGLYIPEPAREADLCHT